MYQCRQQGSRCAGPLPLGYVWAARGMQVCAVLFMGSNTVDLLYTATCLLECRLADGRHLDSSDVKGLLKAFLRNSDPYGCFTDALPDFGSLKPGRHLTPDNVLELFEECLADP